MSNARVHAITLKASVIARILASDIKITVPNSPMGFTTKAIWDTGASGSVITQHVADQLGILPTGKKRVSTANGTTMSNTYTVDIWLKNDLRVKSVFVSVGTIHDQIGCLIGMDIMTLGDLSITNMNNETWMSFRVPSMHQIDFVVDTNTNSRRQQRQGLYKGNTKKKRRK